MLINVIFANINRTIMENINEALGNLSKEDTAAYVDMAVEYGTTILGAVLVFFIGRIIAKALTKLTKKALQKGDVDETLTNFLANITYAALLTFVVISALGTLGVNTASFAATIAAAGLAIGLALQGSLSNFASGVMIIAFRPFAKGDFVEVAGTSGSVEEVTIFTTKLKTPDNKVVIVPNGSITSGNITNYSKEDTRRVDMVFGIGYDDNIKLAKETMQKILDNDSRVLKDPAPTIAVKELGDSSVNFVCRPWVKTSDYWAVWFDTHEAVKNEFDTAGISIPFPQQDVHMHQVGAPANENDKKKAA